MAAKITMAYLLALPIGWERERVQHSVGLRTFPLVAMASCGYVLLAGEGAGADAAARSRIIQGLTTGIGFIGGGAIMRARGNVHGTATAASIWPARARYTAPAMATTATEWPTGNPGEGLYSASEGPYHALISGSGLGRMVIGSGDRIRSRCASR